VDCSAVGLEGHFPPGFVVARNTIASADGGELEAADAAGRRVTCTVRNLAARSFQAGWAEALREVRRDWTIRQEVALSPPQDGFQARWLTVDNRQAAGRSLVLLAPLGGQQMRLFLFVCETGDAAGASSLASDVLRGVTIDGLGLPLP